MRVHLNGVALNFLLLVFMLLSITNLSAQDTSHRYFGGFGDGYEVQNFWLLTNSEEVLETPSKTDLFQNYPNPFNPTTTISFQLREAGQVELEVFDLLGRKVGQLINERLTAGDHSINFDASSLSSGIYIYQLKAGDTSIIKKFTLVK